LQKARWHLAGDILTVRLDFFSQSGNDSLIIISKERAITAIIPHLIPARYSHLGGAGAAYNLRGQPTGARDKSSGIYLEKNADKVQVRMHK
jgi:hypothetical protein